MHNSQRECGDRREVHTCPDAGSSTHSGISCVAPSEKWRLMFSAPPLLPIASPLPPSPPPIAPRACLVPSCATVEAPIESAPRPLLESAEDRRGARESRDTDEERRMSRTYECAARQYAVRRSRN